MLASLHISHFMLATILIIDRGWEKRLIEVSFAHLWVPG